LPLIGKGKIAVIKSTVVPGFTQKMQKKFPRITLLFSPEFLTASRARADVDKPFETIVGLPGNGKKHKAAAALVHKVLPDAPFKQTTSSQNAEIIKYAHNTFAYAKVVIMNIYYDLAKALGGNWKDVEEALKRAPFVGPHHLNVVHKKGRGAGGYCLPKDFAALRHLYEHIAPYDAAGIAALHGLEQKNIDLLRSSKKDLDIVRNIYGDKTS
jgi:UDPglucose 6-dehydrogenase